MNIAAINPSYKEVENWKDLASKLSTIQIQYSKFSISKDLDVSVFKLYKEQVENMIDAHDQIFNILYPYLLSNLIGLCNIKNLELLAKQANNKLSSSSFDDFKQAVLETSNSLDEFFELLCKHTIEEEIKKLNSITESLLLPIKSSYAVNQKLQQIIIQNCLI